MAIAISRRSAVEPFHAMDVLAQANQLKAQGHDVVSLAVGQPSDRNILSARGLEVVEIRLDDEAWLAADLLEKEHSRKPLQGVLFASPANPTGAVTPRDALADLMEAANALGIAAISDEIYHRLSYAAPDVTALSLSDDVTVINSFSKYYCMTGWRIGWMVLPERLVRPVERIQQSLYISAPELSQAAAMKAFGASEELDRVKERYAANRALLLDGLPRLGLPIAAPMDGAFYAYCDVSRHSNDSMDFARKLLAECHVAATPGLDFDVTEGHRFMRLSYAGSERDVATALERMTGWLPRVL